MSQEFKISRFSASFIQGIERKLGSYGRRVAFPGFVILPILIFILLWLDGALTASEEAQFITFEADIPVWLIVFLWLFFIFNLFVYLLDSIISVKGVEMMLMDYRASGMPLGAVRGFDSIFTNLKVARKNTLLLFLLGVGAFFCYLIGVGATEYQKGHEQDLPDFPFHVAMYLISVFFLLLVLGVSSLREVSRVATFDYHGGLSPLYELEEFPVAVDNCLSEVFRAYLDPMAYLKFDEWSELIDNLTKEGLGDDYTETEFERVRELVLYLRYLVQNFPAISEAAAEALINFRVRVDDAYTRIRDFPNLEIGQIDLVLAKMQKEIPQFFKIIDHIMIQLEDNLTEFRNTELFFDAALPQVAYPGDPLPLFLFFFNNDPNFIERRRPIRVKIVAPGFEPSQLDLDLTLDPREEVHLGSTHVLPILDLAGDDISKAISEILQVADALWLTLVPQDVGTHAINVFIEDAETGAIIAGKNFRVKIVYDLGSLMRKVMGVAALAAGAALSGAEAFISG